MQLFLQSSWTRLTLFSRVWVLETHLTGLNSDGDQMIRAVSWELTYKASLCGGSPRRSVRAIYSSRSVCLSWPIVAEWIINLSWNSVTICPFGLRVGLKNSRPASYISVFSSVIVSEEEWRGRREQLEGQHRSLNGHHNVNRNELGYDWLLKSWLTENQVIFLIDGLDF